MLFDFLMRHIIGYSSDLGLGRVSCLSIFLCVSWTGIERLSARKGTKERCVGSFSLILVIFVF